MGNILDRETGIVCADLNGDSMGFTLCDPTARIVDHKRFIPASITSRVTCEDCRDLIDLTQTQAESDDEATPLSELLDALMNPSSGRHAKPDENEAPSLFGALGALFAEISGGEITEACVQGTCDHPKVHDVAPVPADATPAAELSDEMRQVAAVLFRASTGWLAGARAENDEEYAAAYAAARTLAELIGDTVYVDNKAARQAFVAISTPSPLYTLLMGLRG